MLKLYDKNHNVLQPLINYQGLYIQEELNGESIIHFQYPKPDPRVNDIQEEGYIQAYGQEFIIKEIHRNSAPGSDTIQVTCKINLEELKGSVIPYFETIEKTARSCGQLALSYAPPGWTIESDIMKKRTMRREKKTVWEIIKDIRRYYRGELKVDTINKHITINTNIGEDKGCYFIEDINLESLEIQSDTYDLITRLYPFGKDGLTIESVNDGVPYIDNHQWSDKIIAGYWEDNRYTHADALMEDAIEKLEELSKPTRSYSCDIIDLSLLAGKEIFDYNVGDTVTLISKSTNTREKHRIVSTKKYPHASDRNQCTLSNKPVSLDTFIEDNMTATEAVSIIVTSDDKIDASKIENVAGLVTKGGSTGQALVKLSNEDYDYGWGTVAGEGGGLTIEEIEAMITIKSHNIQDAAITNAKIGHAAITEANISDAAISRAKIQDGAIGAAQIGLAEITGANIKNGEIDSAHIANGAIDSAKIADASITSAKIGTGEIKTANIEDGSITNAKIANLAVDTTKIQDASITTAKISESAITTALIADATITTAKIADGAIDHAKIGSAAIGTANIQLGAITTALIGDSAITTTQIADAAITSAKILELDAAKITTGILQTERLLITGTSSDGSIKSIVLTLNEINGTTELSSTTIDGGSITEKTITADNIMADTITGDLIRASTITGNHILSGSITSGNISAGAINTEHIKAGAITSDQLATGSIVADKIQSGSIELGKINTSAINSILSSAQKYTDDQIAYYGQFLSFDSNTGLTIGSNDTPMKTVIDSEEIGFYNGGTKMAYINGQKFYMTDSEVTSSLTFGHYVWQPRDNGHLSIYWRE